MALIANVNSKKKYKPQDFNPYKPESDGPQTKEEVMELAKVYREWHQNKTQ
jgi:hypothetical protein